MLHLYDEVQCSSLCADPKSFVTGNPTAQQFRSRFGGFVFFVKGREDTITTKSGPSSAHQRNSIKMTFAGGPNIVCWLSSFQIFHGIRTSIAKEPHSFVIFQGGGAPDPLPPSGSAHEASRCS